MAALRAVVPVSPTGKLRLAGVLDPRERASVIASMCAHVVSRLQAVGLRVAVLTPRAITVPGGVELWIDERQGLNASLGVALRRLNGPALVVPADLPWLESQDVEEILAEPGDVVIARSLDGGTGALLARASTSVAFGPGSTIAHAATARTRGLRARVVRIPGFERDLDSPSALQAAAMTAPAFLRGGFAVATRRSAADVTSAGGSPRRSSQHSDLGASR